MQRHRLPRSAWAMSSRLEPDPAASRCTLAMIMPGVAIPESLLHRMQVAVAGQAFDRGDVGAVRLDREHGARLHRLAVDQDGARAADAGLAADVRAGEAAAVTQEMNEQQTRLDDVIARRVVDPDADRNGHGTTSEGGHPTASSRRTQRGRISL